MLVHVSWFVPQPGYTEAFARYSGNATLDWAGPQLIPGICDHKCEYEWDSSLVDFIVQHGDGINVAGYDSVNFVALSRVREGRNEVLFTNHHNVLMDVGRSISDYC